MYVGLKQLRGDGEHYLTPAQAAAKETTVGQNRTWTRNQSGSKVWLPNHSATLLPGVNKWKKMVNFKLGNEVWKVNWLAWGKEKHSESPIGIKFITSQT